MQLSMRTTSIARRAFNTALQQRPNDAAALDGLTQVNQRATLTRIDQLQQKAQRTRLRNIGPMRSPVIRRFSASMRR
jgi:hypothetical protein